MSPLITPEQIARAITYNDSVAEAGDELLAMLVATFQQQHGLVVDGKLGPLTRTAIQQSLDDNIPLRTRPTEPIPLINSPRRTFEPPLHHLPKDRAEVLRVYGNPGFTSLIPGWERTNMVTAKDLPGTWNTGARKIYCHRLAEPYIREALTRCDEQGVIDQIHTIGCFNFRHQRHDPDLPLSYHSWGIAFDINSADNSGWAIKNPPPPWSPAWWRRYPRGLSEKVVTIFEAVGFQWGGRWKSYTDPMHFELTA